MNPRTSQGHAMRSVFGRSRVTHVAISASSGLARTSGHTYHAARAAPCSGLEGECRSRLGTLYRCPACGAAAGCAGKEEQMTTHAVGRTGGDVRVHHALSVHWAWLAGGLGVALPAPSLPADGAQ